MRARVITRPAPLLCKAHDTQRAWSSDGRRWLNYNDSPIVVILAPTIGGYFDDILDYGILQVDWLINGALVGIAATIVMDVWALVAKRVLHLPTSDWALVGRWFGHMPSGVFVHDSIRNAQPVRGELALGWLGHYAIGVVYGVAYLQFARVIALPAIVSALVFALALLVFPWFVMQPALGGGVMASRAPRPNLARFVSVTMHTAFGLGLYAGTALL